MSVIINEQGLQQQFSSSMETRESSTDSSLGLGEILTRAHQVVPAIDTNGSLEPAESAVTSNRESRGIIGSLPGSDLTNYSRTLNEVHPEDTLISSMDNFDSNLHQVHLSTDSNSSSSTEVSHQRTELGQSSIATVLHTVESTPPRSRVQSTLDVFRPPPVLPNLAARALELLKEKEKNSVDVEEDEFRPAKKRRIQDTETDDEGQQCSICFEPWSNSGGHRIVSLKCGHVFGQNCIEKWLQENAKCPQCNAKSKRGDMRVIYAKSISVVDTTGRDRALLELEEEKKSRMLAQKAEAHAVLQHQLARAECDRLKEVIKCLREQLEQFSSGVKCEGSGGVECVGVSSYDREGTYELYKSITISQIGKSRVMSHDPSLRMLVVTKPSNNSIYPGYGLAKLSTVDMQHCEYVKIHSETGIIRDVVFSPRGDGMVLTASTDKTAKLTSMQSNVEVQSFKTSHPVWSCAWDTDEPNYLYCGLQNGIVQIYDIRNPSGHVTELKRPGSGAIPITSLVHVPLCRASDMKCGGLLMGSLSGSVFWEKGTSDNFTPHQLTTLPESACTGLSFEPTTRHCLASFRPSRATPYSRHILFQLKETMENVVSCQAVDEFKGGYTHKLLSRSRLFERPGDDGRLLAAFGDEATKSAQIWDISSARKLQQLSLSKEPALDILSLSPTHDFLSVLTESKLYVYKWAWK